MDQNYYSQNVLSVSDLNSIVKDILETDLRLLDITVEGELSNYKIYPSGHHYFSLKDKDSSLRCVMFKNYADQLRFRPENGLKVTARGRIRVYSRDGAYQLYCSGLLPFGTGDLQLAFEQLKQKLSKEGLFDSSHKKPLPVMPKRIALITSSAGAAVHDMIRILGQRWPLSEVLLLPVRVQGNEAPAEIASAIRYANVHSVADVIITGRGGGSAEDLWAFNDERVARAIFSSQIPVVSAVGHEPDVPIADYVADRRASTPSNAAEIVVPDKSDIRELMYSYEIRMGQAVQKKLRYLLQQVTEMKNKRSLNDPSAFIDLRKQTLDSLSDRFVSAFSRTIAQKRESFVREASSLEAMSPLKVLSRGYTLASDQNGFLIRTVTELSPEQRIDLRFSDGSASCKVLCIKE